MAGNYLIITDNTTNFEIEAFNNIDVSLWKIRINGAAGGNIDQWYQDGGATNLAGAALIYSILNDGSNSHYSYLDTTPATFKLSEGVAGGTRNDRCIVHVVGQLGTSAGGPIAGYDYEQYFAIYPDGRIFFQFSFTNTTGGVIDPTTDNYFIVRPHGTNHAGTCIGDNSDDVTPTYGSEYWFGFYKANLRSVINYILYSSRPFTSASFTANVLCAYYNANGANIADGAGFTTCSMLYIGSEVNDAAGIEAIGGQYISSAYPTMVKGTLKTTGVTGFTHLGNGFWSDGCWHITVDANNEAEFTFTNAQKEPKVVLHDSAAITLPLMYIDSVAQNEGTGYEAKDVNGDGTAWLITQAGDVSGS